MVTCPTCGFKEKYGDFCARCGTPIKSKAAAAKSPAKPAAGSSPLSPILALGAIGVLIVGVVAIGVVIGLGFLLAAFLFQNPTDMPTTLQIASPNQTIVNTSTTVKVLLLDALGQPVANRTVSITNGATVQVVTDSEGIGETKITFTDSGSHSIKAFFKGDKNYLNATYEKSLQVIPQSCNDGTYVSTCSKSTGFYCYANKSLGFNCSNCGCPDSKLCFDNYCLTQEEKDTYLISTLQDTVVYVEHSYASGSGVIIGQAKGLTAILTNRHVVADAIDVSDLRVTTRNGQTTPASAIYVAPYDMDIAVIFLLGSHGTVARINASQTYYQGQQVIALGSPLGIQGSVSNGIISNIVRDQTDTGYTYTAIQTDAAINPGNSGGGLFLKSNGNLIGINTFILSSQYGVEGLAFAIDLESLNNMPDMEYWEEFTPTERCSDSTPYGSCSITTKGKYCSNGNLVEKCTSCGCGTGYTCLANDKCFYCPNGKVFSDQSGYDAICCPQGYQAYTTYNDLICCPPGTVGYLDGYCA